MPPDQSLATVLKEFKELGVADRKAILKRLSAEERKTLRALARSAHIHPLARALGAYSPWLARSLAPIAQRPPSGPHLTVSEATRSAVIDLLSARAGFASEPGR